MDKKKIGGYSQPLIRKRSNRPPVKKSGGKNLSSSRRGYVVKVPLTREQRHQQQEEIKEARKKLKQRSDNNLKKEEDLARKEKKPGNNAGVTFNPNKQIQELHSACKDYIINTSKNKSEIATEYGLNRSKFCRVLKKNNINDETRKLDAVAKEAFITKLVDKGPDIIGDIGNSDFTKRRYLTPVEEAVLAEGCKKLETRARAGVSRQTNKTIPPPRTGRPGLPLFNFK